MRSCYGERERERKKKRKSGAWFCTCLVYPRDRATTKTEREPRPLGEPNRIPNQSREPREWKMKRKG